MRETTLTEALLEPVLARDPAGPRITHYDDNAGTRIELSALTLANWAAKTANMIRDEFSLGPGDRAAVLLPAHWQTAAVLLGVWWAGVEVVTHPDPAAELALTTIDRLTTIPEVADIPEVTVLSLDAFGSSVRELPTGIADFASSVRVHGDHFRPGGAGPALDGLSVAEALAQASAERSLTAHDRVLSSAPWDTTAEILANFVAVLAAGASLVQVTAPDPALSEKRIAAEKITTQLPSGH